MHFFVTGVFGKNVECCAQICEHFLCRVTLITTVATVIYESQVYGC